MTLHGCVFPWDLQYMVFVTIHVHNETRSHFNYHMEFFYRQKMQMELSTAGDPLV